MGKGKKIIKQGNSNKTRKKKKQISNKVGQQYMGSEKKNLGFS